jgi:hypothetical protein
MEPQPPTKKNQPVKWAVYGAAIGVSAALLSDVVLPEASLGGHSAIVGMLVGAFFGAAAAWIANHI